METNKDMETYCELSSLCSKQGEIANITRARTTTLFCPFTFWIEFMPCYLKDQKEPKRQRANKVTSLDF